MDGRATLRPRLPSISLDTEGEFALLFLTIEGRFVSRQGLLLSGLPGFGRWSCSPTLVLLAIQCALLFLLPGLRAFGQEAGGPEEEIGIVAGRSVGGIHLFGYADDRDINVFAAHFAHPMGYFLAARFDYMTELIPVFVLSEPKEYGADSRALSTDRKFVHGTGVSPIGARILWRPRSAWRPYLLGRGGILYFNDRVLSTEGTHLQFLAEFGAGVQIKIRPHTQLSFGYSLYHFSNGDIGVRNPALDSNFIYSTLNFDLHRRIKWLL